MQRVPLLLFLGVQRTELLDFLLGELFFLLAGFELYLGGQGVVVGFGAQFERLVIVFLFTGGFGLGDDGVIGFGWV